MADERTDTRRIETDKELREAVESVLAKLRAGDWWIDSSHTKGGAPARWEKWSDPQDWDVPIPDDVDLLLRVGNAVIGCGDTSVIDVAVGVVEDAASRLLWDLRDKEYPDTPNHAVDSLSVWIDRPCWKDD